MTNVIYLTNSCNLKCDYCYEQDDDSKDRIDMPTQRITQVINELKSSNKESCLVIFGGEPFIRYDLIQFTLLKIIDMKAFNIKPLIITNGVYFENKNNLLKFIEFYHLLVEAGLTSVTVEISFDGSGHYRRLLKSGKSSESLVKMALNNIQELYAQSPKIFPDFRIRYTLHQGNAPRFIRDLEEIHAQYPFSSRIVVSAVCKEFSKGKGGFYEDILEEFKPDLISFYQKSNIPICNTICSTCRRCSPSDNLNRYFSPIKTVVTPKQCDQPFDHFTNNNKAGAKAIT